ncbi:MAG: hypothetical protein JXR52_12375 [Bacteroidales bacterium]|nr:hypothetical protein [Bacteroidales bacterium]MBN2699613.1 hypothetical protein [Bacteroidales bacterium]
MKKRLTRTGLLLILFVTCSAPTIYFDARFPAAVDLPDHIQSIALFDRSVSTNKVVNFLEKGLMAVVDGKTSSPSRVCMDGLADRLINQGNLNVIKTNLVNERPGSSMEFPVPLDWTEAVNLARDFSADALLVLELFDLQVLSDRAEVKAGFRLYDVKSQAIVDEFAYFHHAGWKQPVSTIEGVLVRLTTQDRAVYEASYQAGSVYANRIFPSWFRVERIYYNRPRRDANLAEGGRMMEVNDWDAAILSLERAVETGKRRIQGRAAHNLAVIYEILGDYGKAKEWAQTAWGKYRNKDSKEYVQILNARITETEILDYQINH